VLQQHISLPAFARQGFERELCWQGGGKGGGGSQGTPATTLALTALRELTGEACNDHPTPPRTSPVTAGPHQAATKHSHKATILSGPRRQRPTYRLALLGGAHLLDLLLAPLRGAPTVGSSRSSTGGRSYFGSHDGATLARHTVCPQALERWVGGLAYRQNTAFYCGLLSSAAAQQRYSPRQVA
jgi:hypothetical protein